MPARVVAWARPPPTLTGFGGELPAAQAQVVPLLYVGLPDPFWRPPLLSGEVRPLSIPHALKSAKAWGCCCSFHTMMITIAIAIRVVAHRDRSAHAYLMPPPQRSAARQHRRPGASCQPAVLSVAAAHDLRLG